MSSEVDQDLHRSIEPAVRYIVSGVFALLGIAVAIFQLAGQPNSWLAPNPLLWVVCLVAGAVATVLYVFPVKRPKQIAGPISLRPTSQRETRFAYSAKDSVRFYDRVADIYDARLTRQYLDTLRATADILLEAFPSASRPIAVLDVGAGTGQFIRLLERTKSVDWTCLEPSNGMADVLRRFFDGPPVRPKIFQIGLEDAPRFVGDERFDAIVMNSMLSSLQTLPDFDRIATLLKDRGVLLISDGHPDIKSDEKSFRIEAIDGVHSLDIEHRAPSEISFLVTRSGGFEQVGHEVNITKGEKLYSYVLCFRKTQINAAQ